MNRTILANSSGFTLVEAVIAILILGVGVLAVVTMQTTGIVGNAKAYRITEASTYSADLIEDLFNEEWISGDLADSNAPNGIAGLDSATVATADGNLTSPDGFYTIYWNVADNVPMPNLKTIRVIIMRNQGEINPVVMDYIKSSQI